MPASNEQLAPAIINAIHDAIGVWITENSVTPEKILRALEEQAAKVQDPIPNCLPSIKDHPPDALRR